MALITRSNAWYGWRPDTPDHRDHLFAAKPVKVPATVDLRVDCPAVMNQGQTGACTAHGITGALRFMLKKTNRPDVHLSRLQLYYDERVIEGTVASDAGAEIRDGIKCAATNGVAPETLWPYVETKFADKPTDDVYAAAHKFEALTYTRVPVSTHSLQAALANGYPVVIGISVYSSFESDAVAKTGMVPMPGPKDAPVGGHCMYVVGYGQHANHFTVRNSWDTDWGNHGDCYIPFDYLGSSKYGSDYWQITKTT